MTSTDLTNFIMGTRRMVKAVFPDASVRHWFWDGVCDHSEEPLFGPYASLVIKIEVPGQDLKFCARKDMPWQIYDYDILMPSVPQELVSQLAREIAHHAMPKDE